VIGPGDARAELAAVFRLPGVVDAYQHRPPYPDEVFDLLTGLISAAPISPAIISSAHVSSAPRVVLDLGAGEGALARPLAERVDHVDALDISAAMIDAGRRRPGGDRPNLRWVIGAAETAPLGGPYALVTAGASLHWMAPRPTLTRLAEVMTDQAYLAIVDHGHQEEPWEAELTEVIRRHSRSTGYNPDFSVPDHLAELGLWKVAGKAATAPVAFSQSVEHYLDGLHSTSSLAREHMSDVEIAEFGQAVTNVTSPYATSGILDLTVVATVTWGRIIV
jgi:SAM-dependent methyltransferase